MLLPTQLREAPTKEYLSSFGHSGKCPFVFHWCLCWYLLWRDIHGKSHFSRKKAFRVPERKSWRKPTGNKKFHFIYGESWMAKYTNTNTQIHKYVHLSPNLHIHYVQLSTSLHERDHKVAGPLRRMGGPAKKIVPPSQGVPGANSDRWDALGLARNTPKEWFFWTKEAERGWKSGARPLSRKSNLKSSTKQEFWRQRI